MHYKLSQDQELMKQTIGELAQADVLPLASKMDWDEQVSNELLQKIASAGLFGITIPQEYGGAGADFLSLLVSVEELSKVSGSLGAQVSFHNAIVSETISLSQNDPLKKKILPKLSAGTIGAFSLDRRSTVSCKMKDDSLVLDGSSEFVMSALLAGVFLVVAKTPTGRAVVCFEKETVSEPQFSIGEVKKLLGMRASNTAGIVFRNLELPRDAILFEVSNSNVALTQMLVKSRLAVAAQALGIGQASLDAAVKYCKERTQFNTKIGNFYAMRDYLAQDEISLEQARSFTFSIASDLSIPTIERDSAIAKVSASSAACVAAKHSIRIHGGYGFIRDYPVERFLRDARATEIYLEPNEALKDYIAGSILV